MGGGVNFDELIDMMIKEEKTLLDAGYSVVNRIN
jgi:hypothetical protein